MNKNALLRVSKGSLLGSRRFWVILAVSLVARIVLVVRGGQNFWPDEGRFDLSRAAARLILKGQVRDALAGLFAAADHLLFKVLATVPALVEQGLHTPAWVPALFFAAASAVVIALLGIVSSLAGADDDEACLATLLAAGTSTLFYYSRHFFPYDLSLIFMFLAVACALRRPPGLGRAIWMGVWVSLGFLTYNGYWSLGGVILIVFTLVPRSGPGAILANGLAGIAGLVGPLVIAIGIGRVLHVSLGKSFLEFSGTVVQGDFGLGWRFIPEYFYTSERAIAVLWAIAVAAGAAFFFDRKASRVRLWLGFVLGLYAILVLPSDLLHHFAIAARHVRILAPFLCLLSASVGRLASERLRVGVPALACFLAGFLGMVAYNVREPLCQIFPDDFERLATRTIQSQLKTDLGPDHVSNSWFLHSPVWIAPTSGSEKVILQRDHPYHFSPFLFEGYPERMRAEYLAANRTMRVVRQLPGAGLPYGYPGTVELVFRYPPKNPGRLDEPLLSTGIAGASDVLFLRYGDPVKNPDLLVVGFDHAGSAPLLSEAFSLDQSTAHRVTVSMGSLFPPAEAGFFEAHPEWLFCKRWLYVRVDGRVIFNRVADFHLSAPDSLTFGFNFVGDPYAVRAFSGNWTQIRQVQVPDFLEGVGEAGVPDFKGLPAAFAPVVSAYPGAVRMMVQFPNDLPTAPEPLVATGGIGRGDVLFVRRAPGPDPSLLQVGLDDWGSGMRLSAPIRLERRGTHTVLVSMGSLFPPGESPYYAAHPEWRGLRRALYVAVDGTPVLDDCMGFNPAPENSIRIGLNSAGSTMVSGWLGARVLLCESAAPQEVLARCAAPEEVAPDVLPRVPAQASLSGYPGALKVTLRFSASSAVTLDEPLVSTGIEGAGDVLFLRSVGKEGAVERVQLGLDHWGSAAVLSKPFGIDRAQVHSIVVIMGSLYPRLPLSGGGADDSVLSRSLYVSVDGNVMIRQVARFHETTPSGIHVAANTIGASTARTALRGRVIAVEALSREDAIRAVTGR